MGSTHFLALVFSGEDCYYLWKRLKDEKSKENFRLLGINLFTKYISIVEKMPSMGWDKTKAVRLCDEMKGNN